MRVSTPDALSAFNCSTARATRPSRPPKDFGQFSQNPGVQLQMCSWLNVKPSFDTSIGPRTV
jgi:hypothetical protein